MPNVFGREAGPAIEELVALGFVVVDYLVCSGSVGEGEVRQVVYPDATELVGKEGVTDEGRNVQFGSVVEVKIGTGLPCE